MNFLLSLCVALVLRVSVDGLGSKFLDPLASGVLGLKVYVMLSPEALFTFYKFTFELCYMK